MWLKTINDVAEQLCYLIKDHDVCLIVAELYVKKRVHQGTEEARAFHGNRLANRGGDVSDKENKLFSGQLRYLTSKTTIRGPYWRASAAAWRIPNLNKKSLTLKDKLNDLNYIPEKMLTGSVMRYWFYDKMNENEDNYINV
jgi:hypothetical protein